MSTGGTSQNTTAIYEITVGGLTLTQSNPQGLERVEVETHIDKIGYARLTFGDGLADWSGFEVGADTEVKVGGSGTPVFKGHITGLRHIFQGGRDLICVVAMDPVCKLAGSCRVVVFEDQTDSDIINAVFGTAGVTAGTVDSTSGASKYVLQRNESDLVFARRLAARNGYLLKGTPDGKVDFVKAQVQGSATDIPKDQLIGLDYTMTDRHIPQNVIVRGWDYVAKAAVEGSAGSGDLEKTGGGTDAVSGGGKIWAGDLYLGDLLVTTADGAKAAAASELNRRARNFLRGRCIIQGNGAFVVGGKVKFSGHREGFNPEGLIFSVRHTVEITQGFLTEIGFCANTSEAAGGGAAAATDTPVATSTAATQTSVSALEPTALGSAAMNDALTELADAAEEAVAEAVEALSGALDALAEAGEDALAELAAAALEALESLLGGGASEAEEGEGEEAEEPSDEELIEGCQLDAEAAIAASARCEQHAAAAEQAAAELDEYEWIGWAPSPEVWAQMLAAKEAASRAKAAAAEAAAEAQRQAALAAAAASGELRAIRAAVAKATATAMLAAAEAKNAALEAARVAKEEAARQKARAAANAETGRDAAVASAAARAAAAKAAAEAKSKAAAEKAAAAIAAAQATSKAQQNADSGRAAKAAAAAARAAAAKAAAEAKSKAAADAAAAEIAAAQAESRSEQNADSGRAAKAAAAAATAAAAKAAAEAKSKASADAAAAEIAAEQAESRSEQNADSGRAAKAAAAAAAAAAAKAAAEAKTKAAGEAAGKKAAAAKADALADKTASDKRHDKD